MLFADHVSWSPSDLASALLAHMHHPILGVGDGRRPLFASEAFCALSGYTPGELFALETTAVLTTPEERVSVGRGLARALAGGGREQWTRRELVRRDGSRITIDVSACLLPLGGAVPVLLTEWWPLDREPGVRAGDAPST